MIIYVHDDEIIAPYSVINRTQSGATIMLSALDLLLEENPDDSWLQRMKAIEAEVLAIPDEQLPELTPKQQHYLQAFALREDR